MTVVSAAFPEADFDLKRAGGCDRLSEHLAVRLHFTACWVRPVCTASSICRFWTTALGGSEIVNGHLVEADAADLLRSAWLTREHAATFL